MRTLGMLVGIGTIAAIAMAMPGTAEAAGEYDKLVEMLKRNWRQPAASSRSRWIGRNPMHFRSWKPS